MRKVRKLQWGRNLSVAEGNRILWGIAVRQYASMGPQPFGCGRSPRRAGRRGAPISFNGAATFRLRKASQTSQTSHQARASMGPQPFGCGRLSLICSLTLPRALQWGRNLSVAEGAGRHRRRGRRRPASMGPQPFGCGREFVDNGDGSFSIVLQWGRNLSVAEGQGQAALRGNQESFNGAATFRLRKGKDRLRQIERHAASMGPQPFGCGRSAVGTSASVAPQLQWGRNLSVAEGPCSSWSMGRPAGSFNGAATFRLRKGAPRPMYPGAISGFNGAATFRLRKE